MANLKDYATGIVLTAPSPMSSGTSLVLQSGQGTRFPAVPFYVTAHPPMEMPTIDNAEKIKVTAVSTDTLTIERAQGDTAAKNIDVGWIITNALFYKDVKPVAVTVSTAATTATKVGTTADGNYIPEAGDMLNVTFSSGCNVNTPTLNIDGSGAKNIILGNANVSTTFVSTTSALTLPMWYDGTYYNIYGSLKNDNTTYTEISDAEIINTTSTTARLISGRRAETLMANEATKSRTLTGKTIDGGSNTLTVLAGTQLSGTVPIANGGTNASTASGARTNLGLGTMATKDGTGFQTLTVASSAPSSPATGDIWVDTSISTGNYSTSEADTGFKWIDGKTIYKKTINGTINFAANTRVVTTVATGISTIDKLIDVQGFYDRGHSTSGQRNYVTFGGGWESSSPGSQTVLFGGYYDSVSQNFIMVTKSDIAGTSKEYSLTLFYTKV